MPRSKLNSEKSNSRSEKKPENQNFLISLRILLSAKQKSFTSGPTVSKARFHNLTLTEKATANGSIKRSEKRSIISRGTH